MTVRCHSLQLTLSDSGMDYAMLTVALFIYLFISAQDNLKSCLMIWIGPQPEFRLCCK